MGNLSDKTDSGMLPDGESERLDKVVLDIIQQERNSDGRVNPAIDRGPVRLAINDIGISAESQLNALIGGNCDLSPLSLDISAAAHHHHHHHADPESVRRRMVQVNEFESQRRRIIDHLGSLE